MYVPAPFSGADLDFALDLVRAYPFGVLVSCDGDSVRATHVPMLARRDGDTLVISGHVARANPHAQAIADGQRATAVFTGAHAYVSAAWYERPAHNVPTWNYAAVHASGRLRPCEATPVLADLTAALEGGRAEPWSLDGMDPEYYDAQLQAIVAFEIAVDRLECAAKLSQNRSEADRQRVVRALANSTSDLDRQCAAAMLAAPVIAGRRRA